jgi:hypothetical protein
MMKILPVVLLSLVFAFRASAQPIPTLTITEQNETLTADYNGIPVPLTLGGIVDAWAVDLPPEFALFDLGIFLLGEPEDATLGNEIRVGAEPTSVTWLSDIPGPGAGEPNIKNVGPAGVYTPAPGQAETFQLILQDLPETVPDAGETILLLSSAATLMATLRMRTRRSPRRRNDC